MRFELSLPRLQLNAGTTDSNLIQTSKFHTAWIVGHESCSLNQIGSIITALRNRSLEQKLTSPFHLLALTISLTPPVFMLARFYEIRKPFPKSASKTLSHIYSTAKYIFLRKSKSLLIIRFLRCLRLYKGVKSFLMQPTYVIECTFPVNNNARKNIFVVCSRKLHTRLHLWYCKMMKQFARAERNCRNALLQIQSCREALHMTKCYLPYQNDSILRIFWFSQKITFYDFSSSKIHIPTWKM